MIRKLYEIQLECRRKNDSVPESITITKAEGVELLTDIVETSSFRDTVEERSALDKGEDAVAEYLNKGITVYGMKVVVE